MSTLADHYVAVKEEFLVKKGSIESSNDSRTDSTTDSKTDPKTDAASTNNNQPSKKRNRDTGRLNPAERLCPTIERGDACTYGSSCKYNHDVATFLATKEKDIGEKCPVYEQFGYCINGLMCRYGDSHIDKATNQNMRRSDADGGVIERTSINGLSKDVMIQLRKKIYGRDRNPQAVKKEPTLPASTAVEVTKDESASAAVTDSTAAVPAACTDSSTITPPVPPTTSPTTNNQPFNSTPYADKVKLVDFSRKVYIAPLTTVGNLPFRRVMKDFGADITCGEMAMSTNIEAGQASEWALLRKHQSEDVFGMQIAGSHPDQMKRVCKLLNNETSSDFVDLNCGCPIDVVCNRGAGSTLMTKPKRLVDIVGTMAQHLTRSITVKIRTGWDEKSPTAHKLVPLLQQQAASHGKIAAIMIHGRSRLQRYSRLANWEYVCEVAKSQDTSLPLIPVIGNGDVMSYEDWANHQSLMTQTVDDEEIRGLCSCAMIGRGALVKPWLPTEIKEQRVWDISATERLDMIRRFVDYGLEHWGSDQQGVNRTRRFLLEWLSFLHRYVPAALCERQQKMQQRPPLYQARGDLETLLSSPNCGDWIRISEMFLGPVPTDFRFDPKHKSNSYAAVPTASSISALPGGPAPVVESSVEGMEEDVSNG